MLSKIMSAFKLFTWQHRFVFQIFQIETKQCTYPKLRHQDVSNAAQNCHTVKNIPGIFEIILFGLQEVKKRAGTRERWRVRERMEELAGEGSEIRMRKTKKRRQWEEGVRQEGQRGEKETREGDKEEGHQLCFSTGTSAVMMRRTDSENLCEISELIPLNPATRS